jgi:hypothetical protein
MNLGFCIVGNVHAIFKPSLIEVRTNIFKPYQFLPATAPDQNLLQLKQMIHNSPLSAENPTPYH